MTLTLDLPERTIQALQSEASRAGLTAEACARRILERELDSIQSFAHLQRSDPKEWGRLLDDWLDDRGPSRPSVSLETLNRENLYPDR